MRAGAAEALLATDSCGYEPLPECCSHVINTRGPPGLLKRGTVLAALLASLAAVWQFPRTAAWVVLAALAVDFVRLVRFRRYSPRGPRDQQRMLCPWMLHAATLVRLHDASARERVLAAAQRAAGSGRSRLCFAGRPQLNSSRSPKLTGDLGASEPTPWHLFLVTEHRSGADYATFARAAGLVPGPPAGADLVQSRWVAGFKPPVRLVYPLLPLVFDVIGVAVRAMDLLSGRAPRAAFVRGAPQLPMQLQPLLRFLEPCVTDPAWAAQQFVMVNFMKADASQEGQSKDRWYMFQQVLMFCSALCLRPFMIHIGSVVPLTKEDEAPWFEKCAFMFHPSAAWMHRMLHSTYWEVVGSSKVLGDMETILVVPLDISGPRAPDAAAPAR